MIQLKHKDQVRLSNWNESTSAQMFTLKGFCNEKELGEDHLNRMIERGDSEASTIYFGITMNEWAAKKEAHSAYYRDRVNKAERAITVEDGQIVDVEGCQMRVVVAARHIDTPCSDCPIEFEVA